MVVGLLALFSTTWFMDVGPPPQCGPGYGCPQHPPTYQRAFGPWEGAGLLFAALVPWTAILDFRRPARWAAILGAAVALSGAVAVPLVLWRFLPYTSVVFGTFPLGTWPNDGGGGLTAIYIGAVAAGAALTFWGCRRPTEPAAPAPEEAPAGPTAPRPSSEGR